MCRKLCFNQTSRMNKWGEIKRWHDKKEHRCFDMLTWKLSFQARPRALLWCHLGCQFQQRRQLSHQPPRVCSLNEPLIESPSVSRIERLHEVPEITNHQKQNNQKLNQRLVLLFNFSILFLNCKNVAQFVVELCPFKTPASLLGTRQQRQWKLSTTKMIIIRLNSTTKTWTSSLRNEAPWEHLFLVHFYVFLAQWAQRSFT